MIKKTQIIAEVAQSHIGSLSKIKQIINKISKTKVDYIKFQTHIAEAESTLDEPFRVKIKNFKNRIDYWKKMEFTESQWRAIKGYCKKKKIKFLSSPFSEEAVNLLEKINTPAWKVGSGEFFSKSLIDKICRTKKPIFLSTGLADLKDISKVVKILKKKKSNFTILQCTSLYPCPISKVGINNLNVFKKKFKCKYGLSDHSGSIYPSIYAMVEGAAIIEVHVAIEKNSKNPDLSASININQLNELISARDQIYELKKNKVSKKKISNKLKNIKKIFTKSCALKVNKKKGYKIRAKDITFKKPGFGFNENNINKLVGKTLVRDVNSNRILKKNDFR
jgi:N,N'-diacetyllegionaminate synthase